MAWCARRILPANMRKRLFFRRVRRAHHLFAGHRPPRCHPSRPSLKGYRRGISPDQVIDIRFLSRAWPAPTTPAVLVGAGRARDGGPARSLVPRARPDAGAPGAAFPRWSVGTIKKNPRPSWRYSMVRSPRARVIGYCRLWRIAHQGITVIIKEKGRHEQAPGTPQT